MPGNREPGQFGVAHVAAGVLLTLVLLAVLAVAIRPAPQETRTPSPRITSPEANSAGDVDALPAPSTPEPAPTLDELRAACVAAVRSNSGTFSRACAEYELATRGGGDPAVTVYHHESAPPPAVVPAPAPFKPAREDQLAMMVGGLLRDAESRCAVHPRGSIAERECRHRQKDLLVRKCAELTHQANAVGARYSAALRAQEQAYCVAADRWASVVM